MRTTVEDAYLMISGELAVRFVESFEVCWDAGSHTIDLANPGSAAS